MFAHPTAVHILRGAQGRYAATLDPTGTNLPPAQGAGAQGVGWRPFRTRPQRRPEGDTQAQRAVVG